MNADSLLITTALGATVVEASVKARVREMFRLLDIVETTDDGREFHPNTLAGSCRALDAAEINDTLQLLKQWSDTGKDVVSD